MQEMSPHVSTVSAAVQLKLTLTDCYIQKGPRTGEEALARGIYRERTHHAMSPRRLPSPPKKKKHSNKIRRKNSKTKQTKHKFTKTLKTPKTPNTPKTPKTPDTPKP